MISKLTLDITLLTFSKLETGLVSSGVSNRNREINVVLEDRNFESTSPEQLLWIEHFISSAVTDHRLKCCTFQPELVERFCGSYSGDKDY